MSLNIAEWKEFKVSDVFDCDTTKLINVENFDKGTTPYITRSAENNSVGGFYKVKTDISFPGNCITIGAEGCLAFYQRDSFITGNKIYTLRHEKLNEINAFFLVTVLNKLKYLYSYGRARILRQIKEEVIKLPVDENGQPDFEYMEAYTKALKSKHISTKVANTNLTLNFDNWYEFKLEDLFNFVKGKRLTKFDMVDGTKNFIGAVSENNGVRQLIDIDDDQKLNKGNCITVNYNGSVGEAFYQSKDFWASDDVNILYAKDWEMNKYHAFFILTVIKANKYRFCYGRKWTLEKMKNTTIKLPILDDKYLNVKKLNLDFMESYIKSLPYSDRV